MRLGIGGAWYAGSAGYAGSLCGKRPPSGRSKNYKLFNTSKRVKTLGVIMALELIRYTPSAQLETYEQTATLKLRHIPNIEFRTVAGTS